MKKTNENKISTPFFAWFKNNIGVKVSGFFKVIFNFLGKQKWLRYAFFPIILCYFEFMMNIFATDGLSDKLIWIFLFSLGISTIPTFFSTAFNHRVNMVFMYVFTILFTLMFEIQLVYHQIFQEYASLSSAKMAGQAVTNFKGAMLEGILSCIVWVILMLIPLAVLIFTTVKYRPKLNRPRKLVLAFIPLLVSATILGGTVGVMSSFFSGRVDGLSLYRTFTSTTTSTNASVNCFGLVVTMFQELRYLMFPPEVTPIVEDLSEETYDAELYNIDPNIDFAKLFEKAKGDENLTALTSALSNMPVTKKNEYTGICEGYNLVALCAEAFSPEFIDPELTPTLYKLTTNGFIFNNFYSSFPSVTTNGEYTFCMGLFPDLTRLKTNSSFSVSVQNYLPYCYGNIFRENGGLAKAYHNYIQEFYFRNYTHPNMGYDFKAANSGLGLEITWPTSDYDMMVNSVEDYVSSGEQFVAYYMTFSGHYQYTLDNTMTAKNWEEVAHIEASDKVKGYIACNLELEKALTHLMTRLEEEGIADKTMIVLTTDHFPYGLSTEEYSELAGRPIEDIFDQQKNAFICYVPGIEPVQVDAYCSSQDILPTVLNLLGVTYDSRLLAGVDVLDPEAEHVAVINDGSFITNGIRLEASNLNLILDENTTEMRIKADDIYALVKKRFRISVEILNNNYYSFVFDRESTSAGIDNVTANFSDVDIMKQAATNYLITNGYMDAVSDTKFGSKDKATLAETFDVAYRIAGSPVIKTGVESIPFTVPDRYALAAVWAYENGILTAKDFPEDLESKTTYSTFATILERLGSHLSLDTSVDEEALEELINANEDIPKEKLRVSLFCAEHNLMNDNGADAHKVYTKPDGILERHYVAEEFYKLCSWYLFN